MIKKTFDYDPLFGIHRIWHYDESTDTATIETVQSHSALLDVNRGEFNVIDERARWGDGMTKVASIPLVVLEDLKKKGILDDQTAFKKWLDDPENRFFRTRPGKLSK
ncbi:hypothetical protein KTD13_01880 [Burkholderia multivorans]|uniref:hypothetical protein n=1 Tax=Burkholderia multivorans TaxID=87883 RepID=UPI001C22E7C1|nr:hypothetical protein [Burkholderia multivorans]MBU9259096.1 hypothetical protein [Burkholderia multivorans]